MGNSPAKPASNSGSGQQAQQTQQTQQTQQAQPGPGQVRFASYTSGNATGRIRNTPRPMMARPTGYNGGSRKRKNRKSKKSRKQRR